MDRTILNTFNLPVWSFDRDRIRLKQRESFYLSCTRHHPQIVAISRYLLTSSTSKLLAIQVYKDHTAEVKLQSTLKLLWLT
ncbi:uncharacterized protein PHALS_13334 [Plasmopara halstedii]|uniref:Uncharacterized protein n=1 Tax=Plasmopara halstedii TaxID=4781 RepID=A0A0P1APW1_PLAHL|nr:uncharacterized protein PHALS_13334 [Plasmopara halstedii]CEG43117.1 hypothetical protein PHALS_13334 [Plasmopara halstedii]|eukprot:XP_024579486.1 hypothetical protein PHALS_13334 [Plasmopara halstedii]